MGPDHVSGFYELDILTTGDLLRRCSAPEGRHKVAAATGISEAIILKWTHQADLMRIYGIGPQLCELLVASGVDSVQELRNRDPERLASDLERTNRVRRLTLASPTVESVRGWIDWARSLEPVITP